MADKSKLSVVVGLSTLSRTNGSISLIEVSVYWNLSTEDGSWINPISEPAFVRWCVDTKGWKDYDEKKPYLCLNDGVRYSAPSECVHEYEAKVLSRTCADGIPADRT